MDTLLSLSCYCGAGKVDKTWEILRVVSGLELCMFRYSVEKRPLSIGII